MVYNLATQCPKTSSGAHIISSPFESAHSQIQKEIKKRKLEDWNHIILHNVSLTGIQRLWNHQIRKDYFPTRNIPAPLLQAISDFHIIHTNESKMLTTLCERKENCTIWPPGFTHFTFVDFIPIDIKIVHKSKIELYMWTVHIWSVESSRDVAYIVLSFPKDALDIVDDFLTLMQHLHTETVPQNVDKQLIRGLQPAP